MDLLSALRWRYATKRFDTQRRVSQELVDELTEVARLAPSSFGLAAWKFAVVTDPDLRTKLRTAARDQPQVTEASHLLVFLAKDEITPADVEQHVRLTGDTRHLPDDARQRLAASLQRFIEHKGAQWVRTWAERQVYIPLGMTIEAAALRGIDACPMEGFDGEPFDAMLGISGYHAVALLAIGYRAPDDRYATLPKVRAPRDRVVVERGVQGEMPLG